MRTQKRSLLSGIIISIIAHVVYISGLSLIIPVLFLLFVPQELMSAVSYARPVLISAGALVFVSIVTLYIYNKSVGRTFFSLGLATFVPGAIALLFSVYNKEIIFAFIEKYISGFELIVPMIDTYLQHALPTVWTITAVYLAIGFLFILIGTQRLRMESATSLARRVFGPRARIIK